MNVYNLKIATWDKWDKTLDLSETERIAETEEQAKESYLRDYRFLRKRAKIIIYKISKTFTIY